MPAVNPRVLNDLKALQPGLLGEVIDVFLGEAPGHLSRLEEAYDAKDGRTFERAAHTLKGSSGNLGAQALSRLCHDLQSVGHAGDWAKVGTLLPGLDVEFGAVKAELLAEKARL